MASKSAYQASEKGAEIEELLDELDKLLERLRALYEQYFLGISKIAPSTLFTEVERKLRDLTQIQIKNTALRYRFATTSQKFGAYSMYWKRTMRLIESGKYVRDLQRVQRQAAKTGEAIPEEILASMPKMMRERVQRERAAVLKIEARKQADAPAPEAAAKPAKPAAPAGPKHMHRLDEALPEDVDLESMFAALTKEAEDALDAHPPVVRSRPPKMDTVPPPARPSAPPPIPQRPSAPAAARTGIAPPAAAKAPAPPPGMNETETRSLFQKYLKARELCGESNDGVTYDKLVRTLRSQSSKIMTDGRVKGVEFGVVIKDNKVILKAKPKAK